MFLTAYYFRAHMYTLVPRHVREDMAWMADVGTKAVAISVLEQDLFAARENMDTIAREADRAGMCLYAAPSRWGGLVAGSPKVPSIFCARYPDALARTKDGKPVMGAFGPIASVHHPRTLEFFHDSLRHLFDMVPVSGLIWDEPKALSLRDHSQAAARVFEGKDLEDPAVHSHAQAGFFDRVGAEAVGMQPGLRLCLFVGANQRGDVVERLGRLRQLHDLGCDGRPFKREDGGSDDSGNNAAVKLLCDHAPFFVELARRHGKTPLLLVENHAMTDRDIAAMDRRLPEVLSLGAEHILYYYYPRSLKDPDRVMYVLAGHLRRALG